MSIIETTQKFIFKLIQKEKAWLFLFATLFASSYVEKEEFWHIAAGLFSAWAIIIAFLAS